MRRKVVMGLTIASLLFLLSGCGKDHPCHHCLNTSDSILDMFSVLKE